MKVYLATLGCKLNESELENWSRRFAGEGHQIVDDPREADLCVLNTCTVTHVAARKSRQLARQLARSNPKARLVLTGCYASMSPDAAAQLPNVALVVPNVDKDRLVTLAGHLLDDTRYQTTETGCRLPEAASGFLSSSDAEEQTANRLWSADGGQISAVPRLRTRAFVKIQDGCNMSCTYCIIPLARGKEHSLPLRQVVEQVAVLVAAGHQEIVLTGVQISVYEHNGDKAHGLRDLVATILGETAVPRLRLTSIAPWDLDEPLLDLWRDPRMCRHLHLSLQSGSDTVLRRMRRAYTTADYARAVERVREQIPDAGITTDVIVGFPGESDVEFEQSLNFVETMHFSRVHVFPYSLREGTLAATMPLHVADAVREARAKQMQMVADASAHRFAERFVGRVMPVLWETRESVQHGGPSDGMGQYQALETGMWSGYTDNYIRVSAPSETDLHNRIAPARLTAAIGDTATGELNY
jgi:threonylcarbamoyladenosine tRNA methylthiotransferase MtaB